MGKYTMLLKVYDGNISAITVYRQLADGYCLEIMQLDLEFIGILTFL